MVTMDTLMSLVDLCPHVDQYLAAVIAQHGALTYPLLAAVVFFETGVVVTPFLPAASRINCSIWTW
jgi:membrane-associated protein